MTQSDNSRPWLTSYAPGVPADIAEVTESLPAMLRHSAEKYRSKTALEFFGQRMSYSRLLDRVERTAGGLRDLGVQRGDRVALVLPNCPQYVVAFYAVLRLGAIVVAHNPLYTAWELRHQFEDHGARTAIVWDVMYDTVAGFPDDVRPEHIVAVDMTHAMPLTQRIGLRLPIERVREARDKLTRRPRDRHATSWKDVTGGTALPQEVPAPSVDDIAVLQYTSGTTGVPKAAVLTHRNLRANAMQGLAWVPNLREGRETFYGVLPLFHAYAMTLCLTCAISIGARLVLFPTFDVGLVTRAARTSPPTFLPGVPPIYDRLSRAAERGDLDLSGVRFAISGAMSLPVDTVRRWEQATGGLLVEGYGMTEASPIALGNPMSTARRPGTVGVPFPSTDARVVNPERPDTALAYGEQGELLVRGPQVFAGYWKRPEETAQTLLPGGWLRTGDIVTMSADGFVTIVDRRKELIITGGFNVSPSEVEAALRSHSDIEDAAVVAFPRGDGGEMVAAAVVLRAGAQLDPAALRAHCHTRLAAYKVPRRIVAVDDLPRSMLGKVLRKQVRERLIDG